MAGTGGIGDRLVGVLWRGLIGAMLWLPYPARVRLSGRFFSYVVAPLAGYDRRVRENLALIFPQMAKPEVAARLAAAEADVAAGRLLPTRAVDGILGLMLA